MECRQCGEANRAGARFCAECGAPLALRCASCDAELRPTAKFCDECGTPTGSTPQTGPAPASGPRVPATVATRKIVTALFADLVGSTAFGERTDPEVARLVMARYHALLQAAVDAHGGTVAKFMGDGMMATFGIPEIAEDDALRAVRAGVDLQRRFTDFAAEIERGHGETLGLRVGVNTGEVVIASGDADLVGDALNVAARIEHACRPGNVTVGGETWRLTRGEFGYESLGEVSVAGRARPVAIFEVAASGAAEVETAAPFVGRVEETMSLRRAFDAAVTAGAARLVTVLGSPGVGKTRLSRELCATLTAAAGAVTVELRCDRAGDATFAPIAQLIREATDLGDDLDAAAARDRLGTLLAPDEPDRDRLVDVFAGLVGAAPARSVEETFWAIRRLVSAAAAGRPMVVVIDDIQWAEPLLLDLLEHLAEWVQDVALLIVCLARPELRDVRPSLAEPGRRVEAVLALDGLDAAATEALAAGLLGTDRLPTGLVERLPASTDGNPLFVRELVRMLVDDQVICRHGDGWELAIDAEAVEVPPTIQSLLAARVERLPGDERAVLELASVIGYEFNLGALREVAGAHTPLPALLESMRRKELVEPTGTYWGDEPVHRFHHVLIRDAAYRRLLKTTRAELHERVAMWTDAAAVHLIGEHESVIAFHYEQAYRYRAELGSVDEHVAGLGRRAAELLSTAADRALGRDDLAAAGGLARRAIALLPTSDATARSALLLIGCECLLASGDVAAAAPLVAELRDLAGPDRGLAAWAACFEAQLVGLTDPDGLVGAEVTTTEAAAVMEALGDGAGEAKAHQVHAALLARLGRVGDAELELDLALGAARRVDDRRRVTAVLGAAPLAALWGPSPVARAGGRCLDVVRLLRITTASPSVEATSMRCQAVLEALRGRFDVARSMLDASRTTLEELGLRHGLLETAYLAGVVELVAGDPAAAIAPLRDAYEGLREMGVGIDAGRAAALLAHALVAEGRVDDAEPFAAASEQLAGQDLKTAIAWRVARAEVLAARGDTSGGVALAEEAVRIAAATDLVIDHADACVALAALHAQAGDPEAARSARAEAARLYDVKGATVPAERLSEPATLPGPDPTRTRTEPSVAVPTATPVDGETRTALAQNAAAALLARAWELTAAGRFDEVGRLCGDDAVVIDRQRIVGEDLVGRDAIVENSRAVAALGVTATRVEPLAVRGSRLVLARTVVSFGSFENVFLSVAEVDAEGRGRCIVTFDESQLADAVAELDARYLAGEGASDAWLLRTILRSFAAVNARDWDTYRDTFTPDFVCVDRRQIGWPTLDRSEMVATMREYTNLAPDLLVIARTVEVRGSAAIWTVEATGTTADGSIVAWVICDVGQARSDGIVASNELFDLDDFPSALARRDELSSAEPADPRTPDSTNAAVAAVLELGARLGRWSEIADRLAPDMVLHDRRRLVGGQRVEGRNAVLATDRATAAVGLDLPIERSVIAVRGDRLALVEGGTSTVDGLESAFLTLIELDAHGRVAAIDVVDEADLTDALAELDARYLAGEGAACAWLLRPTFGSFAAANVRDWDAYRDSYSPDFVCTDRRQIGWPTLDRDGIVATIREYTELAPDLVMLLRKVEVHGTVSLGTIAASGRTTDGSTVEWALHSVARFRADGAMAANEFFDEDDFPAALARLDELSSAGPADPRHPRAENAATRARGRVLEQFNAGRFDQAVTLLHEDFERIDRRSVVSMPTSRGRDAFIESSRVTFAAGFTHISYEPIAVRGDRLELSRVTMRAADGHEMVFLNVGGADETGRASSTTSFDEDALDEAIADLDQRYLAGEGSLHGPLLDAGTRVVASLHAEDWAGVTALLRDDFTFVDHRQLSNPTLDRDGYVAMQQMIAEQFRQRLLIRSLHLAGDASLATFDVTGTDDAGGTFVWSFHLVATLAGGGIGRMELFDEDDFPAATARFDELRSGSAAPPAARLENTATRAGEQLAALFNEDRFEDLARLIAPDFVNEDRRTTVSWGRLGRETFLAGMRTSRDVGFRSVPEEVIAIRGDRLALRRVVQRTEAGDEIADLMIGEVDADGRLQALVTIDDGRLPDALAELDERFIAGEGADHEYLIRRCGDFVRSMADLDGAATLALCDPAIVFTDARALGLGTMDIDGVRAMVAARAEQVTRDVSLFRTLEVRGDAVLGFLDSRGVDSHGVAAIYEVLWVTRFTAGRIRENTWYDIDDHAAARARFESIAAEPRTPYVDNACVRALVRSGWLARFGDLGAAVDAIAEDIVAVDHRTGVAGLRIAGRDAYVTNQIEIRRLLRDLRIDWFAVRGDRLALARVTWSSEGGDEVVHAATFEIDATGRLGRNDQYDDLAEAYDALEARYAEIRPDDPGPVERVGEAQSDALRRGDRDAAARCFAPDFVSVDHRTLGFGTATREEFLDRRRAMAEATPNSRLRFRKVYTRGPAGIVVVHLTGATAEGSEYDWHYVSVVLADDHDRIVRMEYFPEERWTDALARFDELAAAGRSTSAPRDPSNRITQTFRESLARVADGVSAVESLIAADVVIRDRRAGISAGTITGREAFVANAGAHLDVFARVHTSVLAVRGDRLALMRMDFESDGFVSTRLNLLEADESGRLVALGVFDDADFETAIDELDERAAALAPPEHQSAYRHGAAVRRASRRPGPDAMRALMAPDFVLEDHRTLGYGSVDLADLTALQEVRDEQVTDDRKFHRSREIAGDTILAWYETHASAPDGGEYVWSHWVIWHWVDGLWARLEMFDLDDEAAARARFAELATPPPHDGR